MRGSTLHTEIAQIRPCINSAFPALQTSVTRNNTNRYDRSAFCRGYAGHGTERRERLDPATLLGLAYLHT